MERVGKGPIHRYLASRLQRRPSTSFCAGLSWSVRHSLADDARFLVFLSARWRRGQNFKLDPGQKSRYSWYPCWYWCRSFWFQATMWWTPYGARGGTHSGSTKDRGALKRFGTDSSTNMGKKKIHHWCRQVVGLLLARSAADRCAVFCREYSLYCLPLLFLSTVLVGGVFACCCRHPTRAGPPLARAGTRLASASPCNVKQLHQRRGVVSVRWTDSSYFCHSWTGWRTGSDERCCITRQPNTNTGLGRQTKLNRIHCLLVPVCIDSNVALVAIFLV